ncbi:MAG: RusA family crossover junction endodeoxyribonuclease [Planctomycetota bacterium]
MKPPRTTHQQKQIRIIEGKPVIFEPPTLVAARGKLAAHLYKHRPEKPFDGPLRVIVKWLFPTKKKELHSHYKTTRPDTHNLNKLLFDVMEDLKFFKDDARVAVETIEKFWTCEIPGIWIRIEQLTQPGETGDQPSHPASA